MSATGLGTFWDNLKALPQNLKESASRHETPSTDRSRSQAIFGNVFLHIHATRVHVRTLKFSTTMAMGVATLSFFFILVVTGVLLMVYYKPSVAEAYNSIKDIHFVVPTGRFIRNIHRWAAHLMVAGVLLHMFRVLATAAVCVLLGVLFDAPLKEMANPSIPENPAKAPWYFLGLQEMVSYSAFMGGLIIPLVVVIGLALIPYLDREEEPAGVYLSGKRGKKVALHSVIFAAVLAVLSVAIPVNFGWLRAWFPNISQLVIIFVNPGTLLTLAYALWSIFILQREGSTRMGAIALFTSFVVGFVILTYVGTFLRGPNWAFYWHSGLWPTH